MEGEECNKTSSRKEKVQLQEWGLSQTSWSWNVPTDDRAGNKGIFSLKIILLSPVSNTPTCFLSFQVCDKCPNVKYEREGYFVTVDIEKGMKDGEVNSPHPYFCKP